MQPPPDSPARLGPIALVAHRYPPAIGGVESHVAHLAAGLRQRGVDVEVVTCDPTRRLPALAVEDGIPIHRFPTVADDDVFYVSPALGAWLIANARRFGLIHAHGYHTPLALQALVAARLARRPFVLTPHYHGTGHSAVRRLLHVPYRPFGRRVVRASRPLICVSQVERTLLQRHFGQHLPAVIVPNGVDVHALREAEPVQRDWPGRLVLSAGRLEAYKHVEEVVGAMRHLEPEDRLVIIGSGPAAADVQAEVSAHDLDDRVRLIGQVSADDLRRWLRAADVVVSLSSHEAFGIGILEAAVAGAGVVASDIPAHREVASYLPPGRVAFVAPGSSAATIAGAVRSMARQELADDALAGVPTWAGAVEGALRAYVLATTGSSTRGSSTRRSSAAAAVPADG